MRTTSRRMRPVRTIAALAGVLMMLVTFAAAPAGAQAATVTVSPTPTPVTPDQTSATVSVKWTGQKVNTLIFIQICRKPASDPTFVTGFDCSSLSEVTSPGTADGAGEYPAYDAFRGAEPSGDGNWGCFAPGDTVPNGITNNGCWVVVTNNVNSNKTDAVSAPLTFSSEAPVVPEAPWGVLLPVSAAAVAVGGFFFLRRRSATAGA